MLRLGGALVAICCLLLLLPVAASATTYVSAPDYRLIMTGDDSGTQLSVSYDIDNDRLQVFGTDLVESGTCTGTATVANCPKGAITTVVFSMGGGNDDWSDGAGPQFPLVADA